MQPFPLTVLQGGINRLRVKGAARANMLYDLLNGYVTNAGSVSIREGTFLAETLNANSAGLMSMDGSFNVFSTSFIDVPSGYIDNVLYDANDPTASIVKIWFAKPFLGFPFVIAQFSNGDIVSFWLQSNGTWQPSTVYFTGSIVTPDVPNGLAYLAVRDMLPNPVWAPNTAVTLGEMVEPTEYNGFAFRAIAVSAAPGTTPFTGSTEPAWPSVAGATIQEFGDFDLAPASTATTASEQIPLGSNITDRYGDSSEIAGQSGVPTTLTTPTASTAVTVWSPGTLYAPGAVVRPSTTQGAFINAIPNGDFEAGDDGNWVFSNGEVIITDNPTQSYAGDYCLQAELNSSTETATMTDFGVVTPGQSVTASCYANPNNSGTNLTVWIVLRWYNSSDVYISSSPASESVGQVNSAEGFGYRKIAITANAPANAAHCRVEIVFATGIGSPNAAYVDNVSWSLEVPSAVSQFLFEAVQPTAGTSGATQPSWPTTAGNTVVDNTVTWEAIGTSIVTWQAVPIMMSGGTAVIETLGSITPGSGYVPGVYDSVPLTGGTGSGAIADITVNGSGDVSAVAIQSGGTGYTVGDTLSASNTHLGNTGSGFSVPVATVSAGSGEPDFPTTIGNTVNDPSSFTTADGFVNDTSMSWEAISRAVSDENIPNNPAAALGASHIFEGNDDIVSYSAAVNPTDWTSANNAGYLPTGLNNYGDNPVKVLALYRSNLIVFNAGGYQMWQIDPDPANMALLDAEPVGSEYTLACQSVANDLLFLAEVGVRNIGTTGATANMQIGNTGQPIDPLVLAQLQSGDYENINIISLYYPARGQYWLIFGPQAFVLTINGQGVRSWSRYTFPDTITDWTLNEGILYLRTAGNLVLEVSAETELDEAQEIQGSISGDVLTVTSGSGIEVGSIVAGAEPGTTIVAPLVVPLDFAPASQSLVDAGYVNAGNPFQCSGINPTNGTILMGDSNINMFRSTDGGNTWVQHAVGLSNGGKAVLQWGGGTTWFIYCNLFYYSTDDGITWTRINTAGVMNPLPIGSAFDGVNTAIFVGDTSHVCSFNTDISGNPVNGWTIGAMPNPNAYALAAYQGIVWDGTQFVALTYDNAGNYYVYTAPSGFGGGGPVWTLIQGPIANSVVFPIVSQNVCGRVLTYLASLGYAYSNQSGNTNGAGVGVNATLASLLTTACTRPAYLPVGGQNTGVWAVGDRLLTGISGNDLVFGTTANIAETQDGINWTVNSTQFQIEESGGYAEWMIEAFYDPIHQVYVIIGQLGSVSIAGIPTGVGTYEITPPQTATGPFTVGIGITSVMQWPYLDMAGLGVNKELIGVDLVGDGEVTIQIAYRQDDKTTFSDSPGFATSKNVTAPYTITMGDTICENPIPIPVVSPSYSLVLTFPPGQFWDWEAANFYFNQNRGRGY
jgi:hypothetical protein